MSESAELTIKLAELDGLEGVEDQLLLAAMLQQQNSSNHGTTNVGAAKMARLVECLFFLTKQKRNKAQLLEHQCLPVLKTIFEAHFQRRGEEPIHQEIALIALASLRQFAKIKKGRDQLMALCTLDMCERFIGDLAKEESHHQNQQHFEVESAKQPMAASNAQLQDSLCALCLRCLPPQPFPYKLDSFPLHFVLPTISTSPACAKPRRTSTPSSQARQKLLKQQQQQTPRNIDIEEEEEAGQSSDEDYGFWSAPGGDLSAGLLGEDSMMSCSGTAGAADTSIGIGISEGDEEEQLDVNKTGEEGKHPLGSARAVKQYSRQTRPELVANYEKFFAEFTPEQSPLLIGPSTATAAMAPIQSHEQIVRRNWTTDQKPRSVGPYVKIAYPELLDCADQSDLPLLAYGNAEIMAIQQQPINSNPITASPESMRQLIVQKMASHCRTQQVGAGQQFQRRVVFDLDQPLELSPNPAMTSCCEDAERVGKFVEPLAGGHLRFESRFESGNLWKAVQVAPTEYELVLSPDINQQQAHFQWFHFQVSGMRRGVAYTFEIVNCLKSMSMFSRGMQPVLFSVADAVRNGRPGWVRAGSGISYFRNLYALPGSTTEEKENCTTGKKCQNDFVPGTPRRRTRSATAKANNNNMATKNNLIFGHESSSSPGVEKDTQLDKSESGRNFFSLRFTMHFAHEGDICYIAYHYPYTYTRLQGTLERWLHGNIHAQIYFRVDRELCRTLAGVPLPMVTVTGRDDGISMAAKQLLLITARVHPGESNSSWIMHGLLQFLLSEHPLAAMARQLFIFKLVPMLNPDGVINGSHRCSLAGVDLNRVWNNPSPALHPTIFHAKGLIQYAVDVLQRPPFAFIDLHGHSRKPNIFMYGNSPEESWRQSDQQKGGGGAGAVPATQQQFSLLPEILDQLSDSFALKDCAFSITKAKEYSARIACWRQFHLERVYTMESTYWGFDQGPKAGSQITIADLKRMGMELVEGLVRLHEITAINGLITTGEAGTEEKR